MKNKSPQLLLANRERGLLSWIGDSFFSLTNYAFVKLVYIHMKTMYTIEWEKGRKKLVGESSAR